MNKNSLSFCIIGAGMSGLLMAIQLKKAGYNNLRILEKAPDLGGTWFHNTYPGVACDVPSHYYCYSFYRNPRWSRKFAPGSEIHEYFKNVAKKFDLIKHIELNSEVSAAKFNGEHWFLETKNNKHYQVDFLISATGILHQASIPNIPGLEKFKGPIFHTSQWNHDFDFNNKIVAVIGNGSTGTQLIPPLIKKTKQLILFQRTAQWIMPIKDRVYGPWVTLARRFIPGLTSILYAYNKKTFESFTRLVLEDGWQRALVRKATKAALNSVRDEALRGKLRPNYEPACKRIVLSNTFYKAMQSENAVLNTDNIIAIDETGIISENKSNQQRLHTELDAIVLATGFNPRAFVRPMQLLNENNLSLDEVWKEKITAYRTVSLPDFANFFMILGPNSPVGNFSVIAAAEYQTNYIVQCINKKLECKAKSIQASTKASLVYNQSIQDAMKSTVWLTGCSSWYLDEQGNSSTWPWSPKQFYSDLKAPDFKDYDFKY